MSITLNVNNEEVTIEASPADSLFWALRSAGYQSVRFGSHDGLTGAEAILVDGRLVSSQTLLVGQVLDKKIDTVEGLNDQIGGLHPNSRSILFEIISNRKKSF